MTMKTLVIGLGNPILTDDGVGIYTARAVRRLLPADAPVDVTELAVGGLGLMEAMVGYERVILIDALWSPPEEAGEVMLFDAGHLPETLNSASSHDVDLPTALRIGRELGALLPADEDIQIVAIRANDVLNFGEEPTPPVKASIPEAVTAVLILLGHVPAEGLVEGLVSILPTRIGGFDDLP
jgi:hydrogenase maturation protease